MTFIAIFVPMLFHTPATPPEVRYIEVPSAIVADRLDQEPPITIGKEVKGQGGPVDSLIFGIEGEKEEEEPDEPKPKIVLKYNKLNYSNAIFPVHPAEISSDFGWREAPCDECSTDHHGVDFVPGHGADVVSILDGLVVEAGINGGFGTWVMIKHLVPSIEELGEFEEWHTIYAHLQDGSIPYDVGVGAVVEKGQLIGLVGSTGVSTGSHLHFEIVIDGEPQDPIPLMAEYTRIKQYEDGSEEFIKYQ